MLSKIKSSAAAAAATAATATETRQSLTGQASDNEEEIDNDTNNNNNKNMNNNQNGKKSEEELLDIVEVSRKRRLSKGSADSLTGFIRWSFSHMEPSIQMRHLQDKYREVDSKNQPDEQQDEQLDEDMLEDDDEWSNMVNQSSHHISSTNKRSFQVPEQQQLPRSKLATTGVGCGSSAANLALMKATGGQLNLSGLLQEARANKRPRIQTYSPESPKFGSSLGGSLNGGTGRKTSSHLGNVVERLHQQQQSVAQQLQQQQELEQQQQQQQQQDIEQEAGPANGLSYHLQQFLQQQTSVEDLCSSVGIGVDDNNQLALAAAIHRALVDSVGANQLGGGLADAKSTASSTGSSNGTSSSHGGGGGGSSFNQQVSALNAATGANLHLNDPLLDRQRRAYNTRASLHGLTGAAAARLHQHHHNQHHTNHLHQHHHHQQHQHNSSNNHLNSHQSSLAAMNMSNRAQQQRHAQAAAALSALAAGAGSHSHPLHLAAAAAAAGATPATPIVDFKCDTCPSSFDDRHRLMQHQSIHLELKKDWFTETPVDEVMKIFNRRRGEFLCNICNLRFEATLDYDQHNHSVHGPRPYCCQFCGNGTRTFKCWRQYLNHLYDHRYIFSCTIDDCDFTVNRRDSLRFHIFRFHLNCQLPQNQSQQNQLRSSHHNVPLMLSNGSSDPTGKWPSLMDDEDGDTDNEMNVAD